MGAPQVMGRDSSPKLTNRPRAGPRVTPKCHRGSRQQTAPAAGEREGFTGSWHLAGIEASLPQASVKGKGGVSVEGDHREKWEKQAASLACGRLSSGYR